MAEKRGEYRLIAKTLFGLEEVLAAELEALGATEIKPLSRAVEFHGAKRLLYRANLWCRTATRILKPIDTFHAKDGDELYKRVDRISWMRHLTVDSTLAVDAVVSQSGLDNSLFVAQRTKDAIVDQFRKKLDKRPSVDLTDPDLRINLYIHRDLVTLSLDSSGEALQRRGYRTDGGKAPLNEVLAAGILALTDWDLASPLVDPMCGSGTFMIEAALKARRMAPGLIRRKFAFMKWKDYAPSVFDKVCDEAREIALPNLPFEIVGSDQGARQIEDARANARRAGVFDDIRFEQASLVDQTPPPPPGTLIVNPPYGERLKVEDLAGLYSSIGDTLKKKYDGYDAYIFTGSHDAAKKIGLRASRRFPLYNGPMECRLMKYEMYRGSRKARKQEDPEEPQP
jgi:23S rRNA (guanine2445-N2)-methyltransferase